MKNRLKSAAHVLVVGLGLALTSSLAHAQLISVNTAGRFNAPIPGGQPSDQFSPPANTFGSIALFRTGVLADPVSNTLKTGTTFQGIQPGFEESYTLGPGSTTFAVGNWILSNGITVDGTTENAVHFDFQMNIVNLGLTLTSTPFTIFLDGAPGFLDNQFTVVIPAGGSIVIGGNTYNYSFSSSTTSVIVPEDSVVTTDFFVTFSSVGSPSAVPEPSTYGLIGAAVLAGGVFLRRRFGHKLPLAPVCS